jgi:predicted RNA-binding protein with PIN domain
VASIIIDGYNLIGIQHRDIEAERRALIEALVGYRKRKGHDITLVFDGWRGGQGRESRTVEGGVEVVYSALGERADSVIKRRIRSRDRQWIVVSSDREVQRAAWSSDSVPVESDEFLGILERPDAGGEYYDDEEDDPYAEPHRKGSPRKPSKKEKARQRALKKL